MRQWVAAVIFGIAAGAAVGQRGGEIVPLTGDSTVAQRAAFYEGVARVRSAAALDELASQVAGLPPGDVRRFQLDAIVERYVELDAERAVRISGELLRADAPDLVRRVYERLARTDVNAALAALSQIDDPSEERIAAAALLEALGDDLRALDLVSAALPSMDRDQFRAASLARLGDPSPREAFAAALELRDPAARSAAATAIMAGWVASAPDEAIDALRRVDDPALRAALRNVMVGGLRTADSIFAYLGTLDDEEYRQALASGLLGRLAQTDPVAAGEIVAGMPPSEQRRQLEMQVGAAYARQDPAGALAWARGLAGDNPDLELAIVRGAAFADPLRAFDLAASLDEPTRSQGLLTTLGIGGSDRPFQALANRVLRLPDDQTRPALLMSLLSAWAMGPNHVVEAIDWALANANALPPESFERLGYQFAQADPAAAAAYLDRVPSAGRAGWLSAVTVSYALTGDPQAALSFIERYRGDPGFDRAATALAPHLARTDPPAAAQLLGSVGERSSEGMGAEVQIVSHWAQRDPAAAAAWALDLPPPQRNMLVNMATSAWALADRDAMRRWALSMPPSDQRDVALAAAVRTSAEPDAALLSAFSDDRARQAAMMSVVLNAATTDRDAARGLLETHVSDPRMRAQAEQMIETMPRGAGTMPGGGFGMPAGVVLRDPVTGAPVGMGPTGFAPGLPTGGPRAGPPAGVVVPQTGSVFMPGPSGPGPPSGGPTAIRVPQPGLPTPAPAVTR